MITIKVADLTVAIQNRYPYTELLCREYRTDTQYADFSVSVTEEELAEEMAQAEEPCDKSYAEAVCVHRKIAEQLWRYDCFLLHAALIECDQKGYAFAARSGVGKSTHIGLWKRNFGDRVRVVNGDKPIVRITNDEIRAYGTPWNGKEGMGENTSCTLDGICFLERSPQNMITPISTEEATMRLFPQVYMPTDEVAVEKTLELLDRFVNGVSFYRLECNMEDEAAILAHSKMTKIK